MERLEPEEKTKLPPALTRSLAILYDDSDNESDTDSHSDGPIKDSHNLKIHPVVPR